ncbi:MAG: EFR1 family ferrodoxin [Promethearchaeia archaeon]
MKVALIYFSPTGNTKRIAKVISRTLQEFDVKIREINITNHENRKVPLDFKEYDACFFGFPVYGWRVPKILREWFKKLDGFGILCSVFTTYGGINPGVVHYEIQKILTQQGFNLISTAEFLGEHTYNLAGWEAAEGRPNKSDFLIAEQFIKLTYQKFQDKNSTLPPFRAPTISEQKLKSIEERPRMFVPVPEIAEKICTKCGLCSEQCPAAAINPRTFSINQSACIRCYRCVKYCPEDAVKTPDLSRIFRSLQEMEKITTKAKSKYFI